MKRLKQIVSAVLILGLVLFLKGSPCLVTVVTAQTQNNAQGQAENLKSTRSSPPDTTPYTRPAVPEDLAPGGLGALSPIPGVLIVDVVVNNTDSNLKNTDFFGDEETSIAVNPLNPDEIIITAFSGAWGTDAPLWHSTDGGTTWTKEFTIPAPPGVSASGCPCDQTVDFEHGNLLSGAFLVFNVFGFDVFSGTTTNPASDPAWNWLVINGVTQKTNNLVPSSFENADQPWLLVNRDPTTGTQDNVYVAYDDFSGGPDMRVAVSFGLNPPNFTVDNQSGTSTGGINPGHRLAVDPRTGFVYSLFQRCVSNCGGDPKNIDYMLNRSTDGGATWILNGSATGIVVANADSTQPTPKFGTVNALLGGVDHAAVDPVTGDVYYVYGNQDSSTGNDRLAIRRIQGNGTSGVIVGPENLVTGQVQAAIPSVAVTEDGAVGVFYYTFDGFSSDNFPVFTAHLALSDDQGVTFTDLPLLRFLSSAQDNGDPRQRVLGDYSQMKALGDCFFGAFTGNGVPFGRTFANHDPIFFRVCTGLQNIDVAPLSLDFGNVVIRGSKTLSFTISNTGNAELKITSISRPSSPFSLVRPPRLPFTLQPGDSKTVGARFRPRSTKSFTGTINISSNDPIEGIVTVNLSGTGTSLTPPPTPTPKPTPTPISSPTPTHSPL